MRTLVPIAASLILLPAVALAQEGADAVAPMGEGWGWHNVGPARAGAIADVAVSPTDPDVVAALSARGMVWLSRDGAQTWEMVLAGPSGGLGGLSSDEDTTQDVEASVEDLLQQDSVEVDEDDPEIDVGDLQVDALNVAVDQARAELDVRVGAGASLGPNRAHVWFGPDGELFVGRIDGLYLLQSADSDWLRVLEQPTASLAWLESRGLWLAGTSDGLRYAVDPRAWMDADDGSESLGVFDLVPLGARVWAATTHGVYVARDAQTWRAFDEGFVDSVNELPDGLLLQRGRELVRLGDAGPEVLERELPPESRVGVLSGGTLVAYGAGGVLVEDGEGWRALRGGNLPGAVRAVVESERGLIVGAAGGLFRWGHGDGEPLASSYEDDWIPYENLVDALLNDSALAIPHAAHYRRGLYTALPKVWLDGHYVLREGDDWGPSAGTRENRDPERVLRVIFEWQPPGRKTSLSADSDFEDLEAVADGTRDRADVLVIGEQVVVDDGQDTAGLAVLLERGAAAYREERLDQLQAVVQERSTLVASRDRAARAGLAEQVAFELDLQELEARADILSGGAVGRWRVSNRP